MSVDQTTNHHDVEDTDLATYMAEFHPKIKPGSALWHLHARDFDYATVENKGNVLNVLYPELEAPAWSDAGETYESPTPARSLWRSVPIRLNLREERGVRHAENTVTFAHLSAYLMQEVSESEPCVNVTRRVYLNDDQRWKEWHAVRLTVSEATEFAHLLLLLVDIATDTYDEIAEVA